jgi:PDZ domain-containing protein
VSTVRKIVTPGRLLALGAVLALIALGILWLTPSSDYLLLPDEAHPVAPLVTVGSPKRGGGSDGIHFVDVIQRRATLIESIFPGIRSGSTLVPGSALNPHGISDEIRRQTDLREMARSQEVAAAVALKKLGYKVREHANGALVASVFSDLPAEGKVNAGDVIVAVDGTPVRTTLDLQRLVSARKPGSKLTVTVRGSGGRRDVHLVTAPNPQERSRSIIGVWVEQAATIKLPFKVEIDAGDIGGPSAGLAFALDLMEKLGHDVDHGHEVAATGELALDGSVGGIGAIKQKTIGAREAGVDVFLVPAENAAEARRYADGLRIVAVRSFDQALGVLEKLPKVSPGTT